MIGARIGAVATVGLSFVAACSGDEHIGTVSEKVTTVDPSQLVAPGPPNCGGGGTGIVTAETNAVWSAVYPPTGVASWLVGVNDRCAGGVGLARASDTGFPLTWNYCNLTTGCGPGGGAVPPATDGMGITQTGWVSDPFLASTRINPDVVAYTSLANSNASGTNPNMVVAAISFDGGITFGTNIYVNSGKCGDGTQDQQAAAFDTTIYPPRLWVVWRWNSKGTYGACSRYFDIDPVAQMVLPSPPAQEVQNLDRTPFYGVGGLLVRGQNGRVTVVYSNSDHHYDCPTTPDKEMKWESVSSDDTGISWHPSVLIRDSMTFAPCQAANNMSNYMRTFGFINDNLGDYYVALPTAKATVEVWRSTDQGNSWGSGAIKTITGGAGSRIYPFLASDGASRIAIHYYSTDLATDTRITPIFEGAINAPNGAWDPETAVGPTFPIDTAAGPCTQNTPQCRTLGDYVGIAAKPYTVRGVKTYLPAWTQFPPGRPSIPSEERSTATRVSCDP